MRLFKSKSVNEVNKILSSSSATQPSSSNAVVSKEITLLSHLHRFGWLTIAQIAYLIYGECSDNPRAKGYKSARKLVAKLYANAEIYIRILPNNSRAYLLSEHGANRLQKDAGIKSRSGENILTTHPVMDRKTGKPKGKKSSSPSWIHRWVSNEFIIRNGLENGITEVEIYRRKVPFPLREDRKTGLMKRPRSWKEKAPDALIIREVEGVKNLTWVEVENAKRRSGGKLDTDESTQRGGLQSLALWLANAVNSDVVVGKVRIEKIVFVIVSSVDTKHRKMRFMKPIVDAINEQLKSWHGDEYAEQQAIIFERIEVQEYILGKGPRLIGIVKYNHENKPITLSDIADDIAYELMQSRETPLPRTDGVLKL